MYNRVFVVVMDSLGVGALPDAKDYGDAGTNTFRSIADSMENFHIPNLEKLGIGNITELKGVNKQPSLNSYVGKLGELSIGKDTMTGHWEIMGLKITTPFKTFTDTGFPQELLDELSEKTGRGIIGNYASSGTEILDELGEEHMKSGDMIVYTSADSVLQIAAHEEVIPLDELYKICEIARDITMKDEWKVGRIIARPFLGEKKGAFKRTSNRHDYALKPFGKTVMDTLKENNYDVIAIGKINDIFDTEGVTKAIKTVSNEDGMEKTINIVQEDFKGIAFVNLVDFDALYGHRRDPVGYGKCIESFDKQLGELMLTLKDDDLLILTADHGNDPTASGTDHTREYIPLISYSKSFKSGGILDDGTSFANIGATISENFKVDMPKIGQSFLNKLI